MPPENGAVASPTTNAWSGRTVGNVNVTSFCPRLAATLTLGNHTASAAFPALCAGLTWQMAPGLTGFSCRPGVLAASVVAGSHGSADWPALQRSGARPIIAYTPPDQLRAPALD